MRGDRIIHTAILVVIAVSVMTRPACAQRKKPYTEDLRSLRPTYSSPSEKIEPAPKRAERTPAVFTVNEKVNGVLDSIDRFNSTRMFTDGFTVQIYSGQKKQEALEVNKSLAESTLGLTADIQFVQPKFRVIVGRYYTRLEAHRDLYKLRKLFPDAIIIPEKVPVK